ncbi:MAG: hypothetical protein AB1650_05825 [Candidatus Omnitrophota bacterium]
MPLASIEKFYGRKKIIDQLRKRVLDFKDGYRQNVALIGDRYIGKTFILHKFLSEISAPDSIQLYIDVEYKDVDYFCRKVAGTILYEFSKIRSLPLHQDLNLLVETTQSLIPKTTAVIGRIQKHLRHSKKVEAYKDAIALPQIFSAETGLFCILAVDEFQCLMELGIPEVFQELGKTIMTQKQCLYIFASSAHEQARMILAEKLSLLFGNFEIIEVSAFGLKTCSDYVTKHLQEVRIGDDLKSFLVDFTGGHPLYLRLMCEKLLSFATLHHQKEIFVPLLSQAVEDILFDSWGVLSRHFDLTTHHLCFGKGNLIYADILIFLSQEKQKIKTLAGRMGIKQGGLTPKLNRLQEMGLVGKSSKSFYIRDRLFRYWLYFVYQRRRETIETDPDYQRQQFREEFARALDDFRIQEQKDTPSRIIDLLNCFDNESFQLDGRKYKLPVFENIAAEDISLLPEAGFDFIRASTSEGEWFVLLKKDEIKEQDLASILSEIKQRYAKPQRCILITLQDLGEEVRVRALQEHMWIWNERELRTLVNMYNKPFIVA